jgi:cytochrome c
MNPLSALVAVALAAALPGAALASEQLAQDKQCMGCHALKTDGAAPSFQKIAKYWKGHKNAEATLVTTIRKGSAGTAGPHWDKATMPDQSERPLVSEAEAKQLAAWILTQ